MKKRLSVSLVGALVLFVTAFFAGCAESGPYKVTTEFDNTRGNVIVTNADGVEQSEFSLGAIVSVKVSPNEGYKVDAFKVNGVDTELADTGVYTFNIKSNTLVAANFVEGGSQPVDPEPDPEPDDPDKDKTAEQILAEGLNSVKLTFVADGSYEYKVTDHPEYNMAASVRTVFGDNVFSNKETDLETGEVYYDDIYVNRDGKLAMPKRTIDNKVEFTVLEDYNYAEYDNPFKALTAADFAAQEGSKNVFVLSDAAKAKAAASPITGYTESIDSFKITVRAGKLIKIDIVTAPINRKYTVGDGDDAVEEVLTYVSTYSFNISDHGTAQVDSTRITPYATTPEHTALAAALAKAKQAQSYTTKVYEQEEGYEDIEYNGYITPTAYYVDLPGWEAGYVQLDYAGAGEKVYPYTYKDGKAYLEEATQYPTLKAMTASFDGFAPELFEYEDGLYTLREDCTKLAGDVLVAFADGLDNIRLYSDYTITAAIALDGDGNLKTVGLYYYVYGAYVFRTLTYSAWDSTTIPQEVTFDNAEMTSIYDAYIGVYKAAPSVSDMEVVITADGITIDGYEFKVTEYSLLQQSFTGTYGNADCTVMRLTEKQLVVIIGKTTTIVTNTVVEPVNIPEEYNGGWKQDPEKGSAVVKISGGTVVYNGQALTVISYGEIDGVVATQGRHTYRFKVGTTENGAVLVVRIIDDDIQVSALTLYPADDVLVIPAVYIGTFEGTDSTSLISYKAVIGIDSVKLTIGINEYTATAVSVVYNENYEMYEVVATIDGKEYTFSEYYSNILLTATNVNVTLRPAEPDDPNPPQGDGIPESYIGEYEGTDEKTGKSYSITITADTITVVMDGVTKTATLSEYNEVWDAMTVLIDGEEYGIAKNYNDDTMIDFSNSDFTLYITLAPKAASIVIPESYIGEFEGTHASSNKTYKLVITANGITLAVDNGEAKAATITAYDEYEGFTVTVDGATWYIQPNETNLRLISADYTIVVSLTRKAQEPEQPEQPAVPADFYGYYMGMKDKVYYIMSIDESGITLTLSTDSIENVAVVTAVSMDTYINITVNGTEYTIQAGEVVSGSMSSITLLFADGSSVELSAS